MSMIATLERRLDADRQSRKTMKADLDGILAAAERRGSNAGLTDAETARFDALVADIRAADEVIGETDARLVELRRQETRESTAAETRRLQGPAPSGLMSGYHSGGGQTYHRGMSSPSFFADLLRAQRGDRDSIDRLSRNQAEVGVETRALGNTGGTGGSAGEFAPPGWLVEEFVRLARPGRVTADLFHREKLPDGVSTINLPKVLTGTTAANQTTQNTTLSNTDLTSGALSSAIVTIGGKQVVSQQLFDQSAVPVDQVILTDLAADYARQVGSQAIIGTGAAGQLRGYLTPTSTNVVTWTQATPTAGGFYGQLARLQGQITPTRFAAPDTVVMHPRRWAWLASYVDSTGRPLVVPTGGFNGMAQAGPNVAAGLVGSILGMEVYTDPNIPTNLGAGTNQDVVLMFVRDDVWLWESDLRAEAFTQTYADSLGILLRCFAYTALIPDRYLASLGQISGTGLTTPAFAS